ncbi:hypothetical protein DdX_17770 [Ditylenchus destructor]|uniref:Uncharacterized protein n=1 Tax=Ditylenchus destructor TaxID=166010 RepID=A0AAD4QYW0_9BILA|nr:hypothetical protein DdX_17770 [Ditylenchus destructor]
MSNSKPVPPFMFDTLYYLNRNQLERFSIVCRPLKNFVERYFGSKPYRILDRLRICKGSYALIHNGIPIAMFTVFSSFWEFLEQSGRKPIVVMSEFPREKIDNLLDRLSKAFSSAVLANAFKLVFVHFEQPLIEFCETNKITGEQLESKKGIPTESEASFPLQLDYCFTLERSSVL